MVSIVVRVSFEAACTGCGEPTLKDALRAPMTRLDPEPGDAKLTTRFMAGRVPCEECGGLYAFVAYRCVVASKEPECAVGG